jgi:hypothetical protein
MSWFIAVKLARRHAGIALPGRLLGRLQDFIMMSRYCLVVVHTPLVAQDLALTLQELTGCTPIVVETVEEAIDKLEPLAPGSLSHAFVHSGAAAWRDGPLHGVVERMGARLVLMGHAAEMEAAKDPNGAEWPVLAQPFGPAQVAALLEVDRPMAAEG